MQNEDKIVVDSNAVDIYTETVADENHFKHDSTEQLINYDKNLPMNESVHTGEMTGTAKNGIKLEGISVGVGDINDSKGKNAEINGLKGDINFGDVTEEKPINKQRFADAANMRVPDANQVGDAELSR